jgi:hypothetical protein
MGCKFVGGFGKTWSDRLENYQKKEGAYNHGKVSVMSFITYGISILKKPFFALTKDNPTFAVTNNIHNFLKSTAIDLSKKGVDATKYAADMFVKYDSAFRPQKVWGPLTQEETDRLIGASRLAAISTVTIGMNLWLNVHNKIEIFQRKLDPERKFDPEIERSFTTKMIMKLGDKVQDCIDKYLDKRKGIDLSEDVKANISRLNIHDTKKTETGEIIKRDSIDIGIDCAEQLSRLQPFSGGKTDILVQKTGVRKNPNDAADVDFCLFKENRTAMLAALALGMSTQPVYKNIELEFIAPNKEEVKNLVEQVEKGEYNLTDRQAIKYRDLIYSKSKKPQPGFPPFNADIETFKKSLSPENVLEAIVMEKHMDLTDEVNTNRKMLGQGRLQDATNYWHNKEVDAYQTDPEKYMKTHDTLPFAAVPFVEVDQLLMMTPDEFDKMKQFHDVVVDYGGGYYEKFTKDEKPVIFQTMENHKDVQYARMLSDIAYDDLNLHHDFSSQTELFKTLAQISLFELTKNGAAIADMPQDKAFVKNLRQLSAGVSALGGMIQKSDKKDTFIISTTEVADYAEVTVDQINNKRFPDKLRSLSENVVRTKVNQAIADIGITLDEAKDMISFINNSGLEAELDDKAYKYFEALNSFQATCKLLENDDSRFLIRHAMEDPSKASYVLKLVAEVNEQLDLIQNQFEKNYFRKQIDKILEDRESELNALYESGELGASEEFFGDPEDAYDAEECY